MEIPDKKIVAIVSFNHPQPPFARTIYYQVTIDPERIAGGFIRFGASQGDELMGWQPMDTLHIEMVLAEMQENGEWDPPPND